MKAKFINESYESNVELSMLADDILHIIDNENYLDKLKDYTDDPEEWEDLLEVKYLDKLDKSKYKILYDLLFKNKIKFYLYDDNRFNNVTTSYYSEYNSITLAIKYPKNLLKSIIIHEFQHAYDDYRSKGKWINTKQHLKMKDKDDYPEFEHFYTAYNNLTTEVSAILPEIIYSYPNSIFRDDDTAELLPLKEVLDRFKNDISIRTRWTPKIKRSIYAKVSQYWHKEKEKG